MSILNRPATPKGAGKASPRRSFSGDRSTRRLRGSVLALAAGTLPLWLAGCANLLYAGSATSMEARELKQEPGWVAVSGVPELRQKGEHDCGITALEMVLRYWGATTEQPGRPQKGEGERWRAAELRDVARAAGFNAFVVEGKVEDLAHELEQGRPVVVGTAKPTITGEHAAHYEVVIGLNGQTQRVATLDPAAGPRQNSYGGFLEEWLATGSVLLVVIPPAASPSAPQQPPASDTGPAPGPEPPAPSPEPAPTGPSA